MARALRMASLAFTVGCGRYWVCEDVDQSGVAALPDKLSDTGLYSHPASETVADSVFAYTPRFELWSDGAAKRRWLRLPDNTQIDSSNMDEWVFPEGTKLWKEFSRDGIRLETRLLQKVGPAPSDWAAVAYVWADDQSDAYATPFGVINAQGTAHDVPTTTECMVCHDRSKSRVLGVSAIQLGDEDDRRSGLNLQQLAERELLTAAPDTYTFALPGSKTEQAALGYLHANCSNCHNQNRPQPPKVDCFDPGAKLDFRLSVAALDSPENTATYQTMDSVVARGQPDASHLIELVSQRGLFTQMPPVGTDQVDGSAVTLLRRWIKAL